VSVISAQADLALTVLISENDPQLTHRLQWNRFCYKVAWSRNNLGGHWAPQAVCFANTQRTPRRNRL